MGQCLFKKWKLSMVNNYILYPKATKDLENIFQYISEELKNRESALNLINRFEDKFLFLLKFPYAYPIIENSELEVKNLRKCFIDDFLIIYLVNINLNQIEIVRIVFQRMNYI